MNLTPILALLIEVSAVALVLGFAAGFVFARAR